MSLYGALFTGVTGLNAQTQSMAMISDNIANVNTVGYKRTTARFNTLVTDSGSEKTFSPAGVRASAFRTIGQQGQIATTNSDTDIAISGNGFIVVNNRSDGTRNLEYAQLSGPQAQQQGPCCLSRKARTKLSGVVLTIYDSPKISAEFKMLMAAFYSL